VQRTYDERGMLTSELADVDGDGIDDIATLAMVDELGRIVAIETDQGIDGTIDSRVRYTGACWN
jgi:hypothetical protein